MNDRILYDFLPETVFDAHVHLFDVPVKSLGAKDFRRKFHGHFGAEDYSAFAESLFPGKDFKMAGFGMPEPAADCPAADRFVGQYADNCRVFGLALARPGEPVAVLERRMHRYKLCGLKPYPDFVSDKSPADAELVDMLSPEQLALAEKYGWAVMVHLPRRMRLADPLNREQLILWAKAYPNVKFIVAHLGRSYFFKGIEGELDALLPYENLYFDTAMINNDRVLEYAFRKLPRERILFGTDAPISLLLGKALEINDQYLYLMGEDYAIGTCLDGRGAPIEFTTFYREQLAACRTAALAAGLTSGEIENFFRYNAETLFGEASKWLK